MYADKKANKRLLYTTSGTIKPRILLSDIKGDSISNIANILSKEDITLYRTGNNAPDLMRSHVLPEIHMVILRDGGYSNSAFSALSDLRSFSDVPAVVISDDESEMYRIMALSKGADYCSGSSLALFEFKARILSMLRRYTGTEQLCESVSRELTITNGELVIDRRCREVYSSGHTVRLTSIEYGIVEYLMEQCGNVCPVDEIYRRVWKNCPYEVRKTVVEHIRRIRCKLEPDPHNPKYIKAVFGVGYMMERIS